MRLHPAVPAAAVLISLTLLSLLASRTGTLPEPVEGLAAAGVAAQAGLELVSIPLPGGSAVLLSAARTASSNPSDPERVNILIDAGPPWAGRLAARLQSMKVKRVAALFLTSAAYRQAGGVAALSGRVGIERIYHPAGLPPGWPGQQRLLSGFGGPPLPLSAGDRIRLDPFVVQVLTPHPDEPPSASVLLIEAAERRILFMASSTPESEERLLGRYGAQPADVLFVADGGSRDAAGSGWLASVQPKVAIIQASAEEAPARPSPAALDRLARAGIRTFLPGRDGILCLTLDPGGIQPRSCSPPGRAGEGTARVEKPG